MPTKRLVASAIVAIVFHASVCFAAAVGRHGAVAAEHRLASEAGIEILESGGNAVDAAVAAALASGVVNPSSSGIGGGGFMVVYRADEKRAHTIDFRETAPHAAGRDFFLHDGKVDEKASKRGGRAVAVPGEIAGLALALDRFGTKTFADVARPAIRLAREGFAVESHLATMMRAFRSGLADDKGLSSVFLHDGDPYEAGDVLKRPRLAATLEQLAAAGPKAFYGGEIARDIAAAVREAGGVLDESDLAGYRAVLRQPVVTTFREWKIVSAAPPSSGGPVIGEVLNIITPYQPRELGRQSSTYLHVLAEALKAGFADRARWYGDPDFVPVPLERLLSPKHAAEMRAHISAVKATPSETYGHELQAADAGTAHISVVDAAGNGVAVTTSVNTPFGAFLSVRGRDIVLNDTMDDFSASPGVPNAYGLVGTEANAIAPGKRPLSSMSPPVVLDDHGAVRLVAGGSGGPRIISATLQVLLNVLEFSMEVGHAVRAPRIHHQWMPDVLELEAGIDAPVRASLARRGHHVQTLEHGAAVGAVEVVRDREGRLVRAASDARKGGKAAAY
jgi:gamma-glutamyltranspeptidase/glutathione hydrolase